MDELPEFDAPVFKKLAKNDTGEAKGNQGGPLIPEDLVSYFPRLSRPVRKGSSTVPITAILVDGTKELETVAASYKMQTRGNKRSGEYRVTRIAPLHKLSRGGDILVIERSLFDRSLYRLTLLRKGTREFRNVDAVSAGRPSGEMTEGLSPVTERQLEQAQREQLDREKEKFALFDANAPYHESRTRRLARSSAFRRLVSNYYGGRCALCGQGLITASGASEAEAAHIVPRGKRGQDDARNGLALCRSHHWAFDKGMWGILASGAVFVRADISRLAENASLAAFATKRLRKPVNHSKAPDKRALAWHMKNLVKKKSVARQAKTAKKAKKGG
ncbi:HNH endonuclease [Bradyrhizobium sp. INPA03-11B]|uniref:HNH endonuclease n=1 Tax=Bradyrhizobium sp. INPA03-11B TaxID=418598 RepID=UPI00338E7A28